MAIHSLTTGNDYYPDLTGHTNAGSDTIIGLLGFDTIIAGAGNDLIYGDYSTSGASGDADLIFGDDGDDTVYAAGGNDSISGGAGNDLLYGQDGADIILGSSGHDTIYGGNGNDDLYGDTGDDSLHGEDGDDYLFGGDGNNTLIGGDGNDILIALYGNNILGGEAGADTMYAGQGNDFLYGGAGNDLYVRDIYAGNTVTISENLFYNDTLDVVRFDGKDFDDGYAIRANGDDLEIVFATTPGGALDQASLTVVDNFFTNSAYRVESLEDSSGGGQAINLLNTMGTESANNFNYSAASRATFMIGRGGNDTLTTGSGNDGLYGDTGDDILTAGAGDDTLVGGSGFDRLYAGSGNDSLIGDGAGTTAGADWMFFDTSSFNGSDTVDGGYSANSADADRIYLSGWAILNASHFANKTSIERLIFQDDYQHSIVLSDAFVSSADGGQLTIDMSSYVTQNVQIFGQNVSASGSLKIISSAGDDYIVGGAGDDFINGWLGDDTILAGAGNDTIEAAGGIDSADGGAGDDDLRGGTKSDTMHGGDDNDLLTGGSSGQDVLYGDAGNDTLKGNDEGDSLYGGDGDDRLEGNEGDDYLDGGAGEDRLEGDEGADRFVFSALSHSTTAEDDYITDFTQADGDLIDLSALGFTGIVSGSGNASGTVLEYYYVSTSDRTYVRDDGDFQFFLIGNISLSAADFVF